MSSHADSTITGLFNSFEIAYLMYFVCHLYERLIGAIEIFYLGRLYFTCSKYLLPQPYYYHSIADSDYFSPLNSSFYSLNSPVYEGPHPHANRNSSVCAGSPLRTQTSWTRHAYGFCHLLRNGCFLASNFGVG